jgi:type II secretory pathway pseudopilin PulG
MLLCPAHTVKNLSTPTWNRTSLPSLSVWLWIVPTATPRRWSKKSSPSRMARASHHDGSRSLASFTLTELLVVITILGLLTALMMPGIRLAQESANNAKNMARMKTVATALLAGAAVNNGYIPSRPSTRGRWPTAAHQYFGIRTDLNSENPAEALEINQSSYTAEVMRPVHLDKMRKDMIAGTTILSPVGTWLINANFVWQGTVETTNRPKPMISVVALSKTPLGPCLPRTMASGHRQRGFIPPPPAKDLPDGLTTPALHRSATVRCFT